MTRVRADLLLTRLGLAPTRERARALLLAGKVYAGEQRIDKAGALLAEDTALQVRGEDMPYVSRGGIKLAGALDAFALDPKDLVVADFGASTGGFTDCLLQRGASRVYAIDVGYGQLHEKLRKDARVVVMERVNARNLQSSDLPEPMDMIVVDASFIGLQKLLPAALRVLRPTGEVVALVKPQFEVGPAHIGKGGVVKDDDARTHAIHLVSEAATALGLEEIARSDAVIRGPKGNQETFLYLRRKSDALRSRENATHT